MFEPLEGAGKSVTVCDLLSQTEAFYDYTVIIEEGLSYEIYTRTVEPHARPIIIQPDGDLTINYLDTHGLPLTAEHLASAMALVAKIAGVSLDEDKQLAREAQIAKYLMEIARLHIARELSFLRDKGFDLTIGHSVVSFLMQRGFHPRLGARPLRDTIEKYLRGAIAEAALAGVRSENFQFVVDEGKLIARPA